MRKIMWAGLTLMILGPVFYFLFPLALVTGSKSAIVLLAFAILLFILGFLIILFTVISERLDEIEKEKGKYKQYEEEK